MLTLNDGRSELWQWDTNRNLTVDVECSQVHFSNKVFGRSIDVDVVDGVASIPDILLQTDKELTAWAFVGTAENGYTKISKTFKVNKRNKPADYVFTPPEQTTLQELVDRLDEIEESQDPDAIKNAVEDYLEQNPVEAPVQSVNGKTGDVKLIAEDVDAISRDKLQEATNEALAQAKASGEFDGTDGITPHIGDNGNWYIGTIDTGKPSRGADGNDGVDGKTPVKGVDYHDGVDGQDGYTPVKNVDYFDGKDGKDGSDGKDGKTAYQYAKDGGYTGSESDFANKLAKECPTKLSELTNDKGYITSGDAPVQNVNGETGAVHLTASDVGARSASWMPTAAQVGAVPAERTVNGKALSGDIALNAEDVGARPDTWTPTYTDVGAEKSGTAASAVTAHNSKEDAHNDIRLLIAALTTRLDALANSDDTTLDQMAEVVAYIKDNRGLIEQITTGKVSVSDIVNNLTTNVANKPLSAAQGVALKALIDAITVPTKLSQLTNDKGYITGYTETDPTVPAWAKEPNKPSYDKSEVGLGKVDNVKQYSANNPPPYPVDSVNGKTGAVTLDAAAVGARADNWMPTAAQVGARPSTWTPSASDVGAVPTSRTVNGKALSSNITLSASDVGARPSTWTPSASDVGAVPKTSTLTVTGVDADGVTHTWTMYGVAN